MNAPHPGGARTSADGPVKCLIVDDMEENIVALAALLRSDDVEILTARSGAAALELLLVHEVALAFLDVQMPEMDGFELAELIRGSERTRNVPLIFVTAGSRDQYRVFKGYETGAVDFLYKPIEPHILKNKAEVFFQLYRQKRQLAQELVERTEALRVNEMFMAVLGHDLRNPLSAVLMSASFLRSKTEDAAAQKAADRILGSGRRMHRMIEDVMDMARARQPGGMVLTRDDADLAEVVLRVVQEHQAAAPDRVIEFEHNGDFHGQWDAGRLAQVVSNLIGNALQHGEAGAPVRVKLEDGGDCVALAVANSGLIPGNTLPHIFDPFRRGRQTAGREGGLGLGLFIVQEIVKAHRGRIEVDSRPGDGSGQTVFRVALPRA